jgi:hypothetical protein
VLLAVEVVGKRMEEKKLEETYRKDIRVSLPF